MHYLSRLIESYNYLQADKLINTEENDDHIMIELWMSMNLDGGYIGVRIDHPNLHSDRIIVTMTGRVSQPLTLPPKQLGVHGT
jgi:hypothetical protein